jgi:Fe-S-cluster containining protein
VRYEGLAFFFLSYVCVMNSSDFADKSRRRAYQKKKVLSAFLKKFTKEKPSYGKKVMKESEQVAWALIDCTSCGNCCKTMTPTWKKAEVNRLASHLGMTYNEFFEKWLMVDEETGDICNNSTPCQFLDLENGLCGVYELRPHDCATFPHLYRSDFYDQTELYASNLHRCPATLTAMEHLEQAVKEIKKKK